MKTRPGWIAVVLLLGILGFLAFVGCQDEPTEPVREVPPPVGRFQMALGPGPPPQMSMGSHGPSECYVLDTATGELWHLVRGRQDEHVWEPIAGPIR